MRQSVLSSEVVHMKPATKWSLIISTATVVSIFWALVTWEMTTLGLHFGEEQCTNSD
jgi:hypothetical protein